jgi:hypothetical protein
LALNSKEMEDRVGKVLRALWRDHREVPMREKVREVVEERGLEVEDLDSFAQEVVEEAARRSLRALRGVWASVGISPDSPEVEEAEKEAADGKKVSVWYPTLWEGPPARLGVQVLGYTQAPKSTALIVPPKPPEHRVKPAGHEENFVRFDVDVYCGLVQAKVRPGDSSGGIKGGLFVEEERVYLEVFGSKELEVVSKGVEYLVPFFTAIGMERPESSLVRALERLSGLKRGEVGLEGEYALARWGDNLFLLRGTLLGDPLLDAVFLADEKVTLSLPHGLEVSLAGYLVKGTLVLKEVEFRWGEDVVRLEWHNPFPSRVMAKDPLGTEIRASVLAALYNPIKKLPPRMRALFQALGDHPEPLKALRNGEFYPHTIAEMFSEL